VALENGTFALSRDEKELHFYRELIPQLLSYLEQALARARSMVRPGMMLLGMGENLKTDDLDQYQALSAQITTALKAHAHYFSEN